MTEHERMDALRREVASEASVPAREVCVVRSPYRICPLGAHVDHQLGEVTGMAIDRALLFAFVPREEARVRVRSHNFPGAMVPFGMVRLSPETASLLLRKRALNTSKNSSGPTPRRFTAATGWPARRNWRANTSSSKDFPVPPSPSSRPRRWPCSTRKWSRAKASS